MLYIHCYLHLEDLASAVSFISGYIMIVIGHLPSYGGFITMIIHICNLNCTPKYWWNYLMGIYSNMNAPSKRGPENEFLHLDMDFLNAKLVAIAVSIHSLFIISCGSIPKGTGQFNTSLPSSYLTAGKSSLQMMLPFKMWLSIAIRDYQRVKFKEKAVPGSPPTIWPQASTITLAPETLDLLWLVEEPRSLFCCLGFPACMRTPMNM